MSKFTRESPFEFEGGKAWRSAHPQWPVEVDVSDDADMLSDKAALVLHAFIEAEHTGWHWTNPEHTEARNGRWVVDQRDADTWRIRHDDMGHYFEWRGTEAFPGRHAQGGPALTLCNFFEWRTEQDQPEEPTGLGAVVEVDGERWIRDIPGHPCPWWSLPDRRTWASLAKAGPVTVLSEGVS